MKRRITLNAKLLAFALLLVAFTVIVALVSFVRGQVLKTKNDAKLLYVDLLKAHTHAKLFVRSRNGNDIRTFQEASQRFTATLQDYRQEWFATELLLGMERLGSTVQQITAKLKERGLDENSGSEGAFRRSVHTLQNLFQEIQAEKLDMLLLEARRREKDFFLRGDTAYLTSVRQYVLQIMNELPTSRLQPATQQQVQRLAFSYLQEFEHTVRVMQEISLLEQTLDKDFQSIEPIINRVEQAKQAESATQEGQMLAVTFASILVSLIVAVYLSRRLSQPIVALQEAAQRIAEGDYSVSVRATTNDEIADLSAAFNTMTQNVSERTSQLDSSYQNLRILSRIGRELSSSLDVQQIFTTLYRQITVLMEADVFAIGLLNEKEHRIDDALTIKQGNHLPLFHTSLANKNSLSVWCLEHRSEVFINDNTTEFSRYVHALFVPPEVYAPQEFPHSIIFVPLIVVDKTLGVLTVQSLRRNAYTPYHLDMMRTLAAYASAALNNAHAYATVQQQNSEILRQQELLEEQAALIQMTNTQLQERNLQLVQVNQEKNEFLGIAAHDLKNPLASIQMSASIIQHYYDQLDKEMILERAQTITTTSKQMTEIITNLLDINAIEAGKTNLVMKDVDVVALASQLIEEYSDRAQQKKISMQFECDSETINIHADTNATRQVLDNLLSNALKYSPFGTRTTVRLRTVGACAHIAIQDEGPGLSNEDKSKLFGKFARLSAQPTGGENSTGLGLSIVKRLVESMHGRVWCESELGKGATFTVQLPLADSSEAASTVNSIPVGTSTTNAAP
jgi:signal transduction histidine kinase/HAMP domain-containing protein